MPVPRRSPIRGWQRAADTDDTAADCRGDGRTVFIPVRAS
jgi:hypothetical protein